MFWHVCIWQVAYCTNFLLKRVYFDTLHIFRKCCARVTVYTFYCDTCGDLYVSYRTKFVVTRVGFVTCHTVPIYGDTCAVGHVKYLEKFVLTRVHVDRCHNVQKCFVKLVLLVTSHTVQMFCWHTGSVWYLYCCAIFIFLRLHIHSCRTVKY